MRPRPAQGLRTAVAEISIPSSRNEPAPPQSQVRPILDQGNAATRVGFWVAMLYLFALFSLASEMSILVLGVKPYVTWVAGPLGVIAALSSGRFLHCLRPGPGRWLLLFALWMLMASAFGIFRGGSLTIMQSYVEKQLPVVIMLIALITTVREAEWFCRMLGFSGLLLVGISLKYGGIEDNRLVIPGTSLGNPNDFATHLLIAVPFCLLLVLNSSRFSPYKLIGIVGMGGLVLTTLRSGSRGGLLALLALVVVLLWKVSLKQRVGVIAVFVILGLIAGAAFPSVIWDRFQTILSSESSDSSSTIAMAQASTDSRWYIFKRSLEFTAQHPLFGLGPGNFMVAEADVAKKERIRASWLGTHNSYTQASSEGGIPAFVFFAAALFGSMRLSARVYKRSRPHRQLRHVANTALCLLLALVGFSVNILFAHLAFTYYLPALAGLTVAFAAAADQEIEAHAGRLARSA